MKKLLTSISTKITYTILLAFILAFSFKEIGVSSPEISQLQDEAKPFSAASLKDINSVLKPYFHGVSNRFIFQEYLAVYSDFSKWLLCSDLKKNTIKKIQLNDSFLLTCILGSNQVKKLESKRTFYANRFELRWSETVVKEFAFSGEHIYLYVSAVDFNKLPKQEEVLRSGVDPEVHHGNYIIELKEKDSVWSTNRILRTDEKYPKESFGRFSIIDNSLCLFKKNRLNAVDHYSYIQMASDWVSVPSQQKQKQLLSVYIMECYFMNNLTFNYDTYTLINNTDGETYKIINGTMDSENVFTNESEQIGDKVFFCLYYNKDDKIKILELDLTTKKPKLLKTFDIDKGFNFLPVFYYERSLKKLHLLDMNKDRQMYILNTIQIN